MGPRGARPLSARARRGVPVPTPGHCHRPRGQRTKQGGRLPAQVTLRAEMEAAPPPPRPDAPCAEPAVVSVRPPAGQAQWPRGLAALSGFPRWKAPGRSLGPSHEVSLWAPELLGQLTAAPRELATAPDQASTLGGRPGRPWCCWPRAQPRNRHPLPWQPRTGSVCPAKQPPRPWWLLSQPPWRGRPAPFHRAPRFCPPATAQRPAAQGGTGSRCSWALH